MLQRTDHLSKLNNQQPSRNITPNFLRFKSTPRPYNLTRFADPPVEPRKQDATNDQETKGSDRSSSRTSKCSFDVYEKRILNLSKLKNSVNSKPTKQQPLEVSNNNKSRPPSDNSSSKRNAVSNDKKKKEESGQGVVVQRDNFMLLGATARNNLLSRKRGSGSGKNLIRITSKERFSNPKRNEESLQKEQEFAKRQNEEIFNNLIQRQHVPVYVNKMKLKKEQIKAPANSTQVPAPTSARPKKRFFEDPQIELHGDQNLRNYEMYDQLGKGAYGTVRMAFDKINKTKVAVKVYEKARLDEPNKIKNIQRQIVIQSRLSHPTIARIIQAIQTPTELFLIMEYGGANSLYKYLLSKPEHRLDEKEAKQFLKTILVAINYLHSKNIVHRDIKAENILLNRHKELKLIDFGFSLVSKPPETIDTFCGTPTYMAPEIVSKKDHVAMYTDMWSLGVLYYVMLQGNYPFKAKSENSLFERIRKGQFEYIYDDVSLRSRLLIQKLLQVEPLMRPSSSELLSKEWIDWFNQ